jgi:hypothetical protein
MWQKYLVRQNWLNMTGFLWPHQICHLFLIIIGLTHKIKLASGEYDNVQYSSVDLKKILPAFFFADTIHTALDFFAPMKIVGGGCYFVRVEIGLKRKCFFPFLRSFCFWRKFLFARKFC